MSEKNPLNQRLLNQHEAAKLLGISRNTLLRLRTEGELSFYRIGASVRYSSDQIAAYLARQEQASAAAATDTARAA